MHAVAYDGLIHHGRRRALFLGRTAQHVRSSAWPREAARAAAALAGIAAWGVVVLLLAG